MRKSKSTLKRIIAASICLSMLAAATVSSTGIVSAVETDEFAQKMENRFENPEMTHKLYARWWMAEGSHTDQTIIESVHELYDAGFGGIEFVTLDESKYLDNERYAWGSEEWIHDSHLVAKTCAELGMGFSMTGGTHWATSNLVNITPDEDKASQELGYKTIDLAAGESFNSALPTCELPGETTKQTLVKVISAKKVGTRQMQVGNCVDDAITLDENSLTDLTDQVSFDENGNPCLNYTATDDGTVIFAFWKYGTSESYKPATTGKSYTINYFDKTGVNALIDYWQQHVLDEEMQSYIKQVDEADFYMDSLELRPRGTNTTGQLWCTDYIEQFETRRGYDPSLYLPFMILREGSKAGNDKGNLRYQYELAGDEDCDFTDRIRNDMYQTDTDLYRENCLQPLEQWLDSFGMNLRAENSYGSMLEISQPIKDLDFVETESFEMGVEPELFRGMSGAAHLYNKRYSSETGAMYYQNYYNNNNYLRQIYYTQYASGIQKVVTHGYSSEYGPEQNCSWPGYEGMMPRFSERINKRQPWSMDYNELNTHLNRVQKVLEQGVPQMDLAILRNDYFFNCGLLRNDGSKDYINNDFHQHKGIYWQDTTLQDAGYTYDYFSPYLLQDQDITCSDGLIQADGVGYQAIVVYQEEMPYESAKVLLQWAQSGLPVILVDGPSTEFVRNSDQTGRVYKYNDGAAITTGSNDGLDEEMVAVMDQIRQLDNVKCIGSVEEAYDALAELNVKPRSENVEINQNIVPVMRKSEDATYLFLYNYMYEDTENYVGQVSVDGIYAPYVLDTWTGEVNEVVDYSYEDGRTILNVDIAPGEVMIFTLNPDVEDPTEKTIVNKDNVYKLSVEDGQTVMNVSESGPATITYSDGSTFKTNVEALDDINLDKWNLTVESWEPGDKLTRTEDRGFGYTTTEVTYSTNKVEKNAGELSELKPWKDIEAVGEDVSGVGHYTTTFTLPENWSSENQSIEFNAESFNNGTAALFVNDQQVGLNMDGRDADISQYCVPGENKIEVRVTSSLRNIMRKLDYAGWKDKDSWLNDVQPDDYGLTGEVKLVTMTKVPVTETQSNKSILNSVITYAENAKASGEYDNAIESVQKSFDAALENAKAVANNVGATQEEVDAAWQTLLNEIHKLGFIAGDKTELTSLIAAAEEINGELDRYVEAGKSEFIAALKAAQGVYQDGDAMQAEINEVADDLLNAMLNLRYKADKSILEEVVAEADKVNANAYTAESYAVLATAVKDAKAVLENENATQEEVDVAVTNVQSAMNGLVAVNGTVETPSENNPSTATQTGHTTTTTKATAAKTGDFAPIAGLAAIVVAGATVYCTRRKK
ncbi:glycosyl hydrolase [Clostridium facile]|uniref:FIVAR domain-containing protein n=1 Tax=Clostridium facile TaxID=2763035 RepID=A0ABR7ISG6_9CLOT|nr:glycosyl hydrolase [Clostridium facile]MBC5788085.1 FIVAR domain-containing protein [Clostridium facile]